MRVGLSYSRCVRDIVDGRVSIDDVLVIIARTDFDPRDDNQWLSIWMGYTTRNNFSAPEWADYVDVDQNMEKAFRTVSIDLYETGKLHQPRQFGFRPRRYPWYWLDLVLVPEDLDKNSAAKDAWDKFQVLAELTGTGLEFDHSRRFS